MNPNNTLPSQAAAGQAVDSHFTSRFQASTVTLTGAVRVAAPPDSAFFLFTAPGEKLWVPDWDPVALGGGEGLDRGDVWITTHGAETTIWLVVDFDRAAHRARYARLTPGSRVGTVEVSVGNDGEGGSLAKVTYRLTALNEDGNRELAKFDKESFAGMMKEWEHAIGKADIDYSELAGRARPASGGQG